MMTQNEIVTLRANLLGGMDTYIRDVVRDEEVLDTWSILGVVNDVDEDDLIEIAKDENEFTYIANLFGKLVRNS